jgi:hypothetical protein
VDNERVVAMDEGGLQREVSRGDFDRQFSGYALCFKQFIKRRS